MSTTQQARTTEEGGAVDLERYEWAYLGEEPNTPQEAGYQAYEEPPAETDNDWNHGDQLNDELLNWKMGSLESELDQLRTDLQNLRDDFNAHNHDSRYYRKTQTEDRYVNVSGDVMNGGLDMAENTITRLPAPSGTAQPTPKGYADDRYVNAGGDTMTGVLDMDAPIEVRKQQEGASTSYAIKFDNDTSNHNIAIESSHDDLTIRSSNLDPGENHVLMNPITGDAVFDGQIRLAGNGRGTPYPSIQFTKTTEGGHMPNGSLYRAADGHLYYKTSSTNSVKLS